MFDHPLFGTLGVSSGSAPEPTSLEAIEAGDHAALESICLWDVRLGVKGAARLAALRLPALRRLDLTLTRLRPEGFARIAGAPWAKQLTALDLGAASIGDDLLRIDAFPRLVDLRLSQNRLGDDQAKALALAPCVKKLRRLELSSNRVGAAGLAALLPRLRAVEQLDVSGNGLRDGAVDLFVDAKLAKLTHLVVYANRFTPKAPRSTRSVGWFRYAASSARCTADGEGRPAPWSA